MIKALLIFVFVKFGVFGLAALALIAGLGWLAWRAFRKPSAATATPAPILAGQRPFTPQPRSATPRASRYSSDAADAVTPSARTGLPARTASPVRSAPPVRAVASAPARSAPAPPMVAPAAAVPMVATDATRAGPPAARMSRVIRRA